MPLFHFEHKKPSKFPPPVGYDTSYNGGKKKRTSITNFFHPPSITLKRKYEDDLQDQQDQQEQENKRKKTAAAATNMKGHMGTMSRLFQRIAVTVNRSTRSSTPRKDPQPEFVDVFQTLQLPTIEWTNGSLGILPPQPPQIVEPVKEKDQLEQPQPQPEEQEEDSVFCISNTEFMEFPVPPLLKTIPKKRMRQDSCPPKFNSMIIIEEETSDDDDDDESMPSTPSNDPILYDESSNKLEFLGLS